MTKESIPVFLSSDNNYVPYMSALMVSIMDNTKSNIDFYIVDAGINEFNKKQISTLQEKWGFGLEFIDAEPYRHLFKTPASPSGHITKASSDRFLIPFMKPNLNKVIILDVDMIALGDIEKLWNIDLEDKIVASAQAFCWTQPKIIEELNKDVGLSPKHKYFNMGTIIVDCKKWREGNIMDKLSEASSRINTKKVPWWDELAFNMVLQENNYKVLDPKFNMMVPHQVYYKEGKPNTHKKVIEEYLGLSEDYKINEIIFSHFAMRDVKPWNTRTYYYEPSKKWVDIPNFKEFWSYLKQTPFFEGEFVTYLDKQNTNKTNTLLVYAILMPQLKLSYLKYYFLSKITFGKMRERYKNKRKNLKTKLKEIKHFLHSNK